MITLLFSLLFKKHLFSRKNCKIMYRRFSKAMTGIAIAFKLSLLFQELNIPFFQYLFFLMFKPLTEKTLVSVY